MEEKKSDALDLEVESNRSAETCCGTLQNVVLERIHVKYDKNYRR
jgi:hypothetical protein